MVIRLQPADLYRLAGQLSLPRLAQVAAMFEIWEAMFPDAKNHLSRDWSATLNQKTGEIKIEMNLRDTITVEALKAV